MGKIKELLQGTEILKTTRGLVTSEVERSGVPLDEAVQAIRSDLPDISRLALPLFSWFSGTDEVGLSLEGPAIGEDRLEKLGVYNPDCVARLSHRTSHEYFLKAKAGKRKHVKHLDGVLHFAYDLLTAYPADLTQVGLHINDFTGRFSISGSVPAGGPGLAIYFRADSVELSYKYLEQKKYGELLLP